MNVEPNFEKFTKEAKQALVYAQEKAKEAKRNYVGTEHILQGVLSQTHSLGGVILANFGLNAENVAMVIKNVSKINPVTGSPQKGWGVLSAKAKKVIEDAVRCAHLYNHNYIGTEHLLFALVSQDETAATIIMEDMRVNPEDIKQHF